MLSHKCAWHLTVCKGTLRLKDKAYTLGEVTRQPSGRKHWNPGLLAPRAEFVTPTITLLPQAASAPRQPALPFLGPRLPPMYTHMAPRRIDSAPGCLGLQVGELLPSSALTVSWEESGPMVEGEAHLPGTSGSLLVQWVLVV